MSNLLFSNFSEYGIFYKHPKDFSLGKGTYIALLDKKNSKIPKERIDFGALPNQSAIDLDSFQKIGKAIKEKKSRPYDNYKDMIMLLNFLIWVTIKLQRHDEHEELCWSNFNLSIVESGKLSGRWKVEIVSLLDKKCIVTITNTTRRDSKGSLDTIEYLENDTTCIVFWIHYYSQFCPPEQKRFYCYKASAKFVRKSFCIHTFFSKSILTFA